MADGKLQQTATCVKSGAISSPEPPQCQVQKVDLPQALRNLVALFGYTDLHTSTSEGAEDIQSSQPRVNHEISERINYVLHSTKQAAVSTLEQADAGIEAITAIERQAETAKALLLKQTSSDEKPNEKTAQKTNEQLVQTIDNIVAMSSQSRVSFGEIICAQEYQDLCAQVLEYAMEIVLPMETELARLAGVDISANSVDTSEHTSQTAVDPIKAQGPEYRTTNNSSEAVESQQDDVDALLQKLGH